MLRRFTAIALLAAAALTAPAAFAQTATAMARHCDTTPATPTHDGGHHQAPASDAPSRPHCAPTTCLMTTHCTNSTTGLTVAVLSIHEPLSHAPLTTHQPPLFASQVITPPVPPPVPSPIAS